MEPSTPLVDMELVAGVAYDCEAMGNVRGMSNVVERHAPWIEAHGDDAAKAKLAALRIQVAAAKERERAAGGPGSLRDPEHPMNKDILETLAAHPEWLPWWDQRILRSSAD
jgi:hypothetical protein